MKKFVYIAFLVFILVGCNIGSYERFENGIIVHLKQHKKNTPRCLKLEVISDKIIHVTASPFDSIPRKMSLIALNNKAKDIKWKVYQKNNNVVLQTSCLKAYVSLKTGEVCFTDTMDRPILSENKGGGKSFIPNKDEFSVRQIFESDSSEAFYGLGQHQYNIMNYKGKDVDLYQYNTKVSVPFVLSNKNYGILWDNYSRSKFGDIRDYKQISTLKLYSDEGTPNGLTARYALLSDTGKVVIKRNEHVIDYETLEDMSKFPGEFSLNQGIVKWSGAIESDTSSEYKFRFYAAGYAKVWLDGKLVLDRWRQSWNPTFTFFNFKLEKGKKYPVHIEWIPDGGESYISLKCLPQLPAQEQGKLSLYAEVGNSIDYYFIRGNDPDDVISGYRFITGKSPIMPIWAMGLWQSRERYKSQSEILSVVKEFRKREIPFDNIVLDWQYWREDQWGSHEFDTTRFPNPTAMISDLHKNLHTHFMISVWPKFYIGTENYKAMNDRGFLYKLNTDLHRKDWIGYVSTFYDAFNPEARGLFWAQVNKNLFSKGVDAWWLDASEPDIHSNLSMDERKALMNPTALGNGDKYFNAFPLVNEKAIYDGQRNVNPNQRVFILTRSAFAGSQRYAAATWSGDVGARWEELKLQIPAGLNFSLSGIPYWTTDIGGFAVERRYEKPNARDLEEWRELMTRWFQFGTFCPLLRVHGQFPYREMFNIAPENHPAYQAMLEYDKLRYRLMPYIYSLAGSVYFNDYTIMRALAMDFGSDASTKDIKDQFMFGSSLMIAPVYEYKARSRKVYLPSTSSWFDLSTGKYFAGGQTIDADAPLSRIPVFVKEGSILPFGPDLQYASEKPADPITLYIYTGKDGSFELYEDEGTNYDYEKGQYSVIPLSYNEDTKTLTLGKRKGTYPGMQKQKVFQIMVVSKSTPLGLDFNRKPNKIITYSGEEQNIKIL
ncbi:MAG TPA: TIM-barrel domain-containing protein [Bacteroidales bacterium]